MELIGRRRHRPGLLNGRQRAQLTDCQFPDKSAHHRVTTYKKNFAKAKDN
jgi:hypothetical protein